MARATPARRSTRRTPKILMVSVVEQMEPRHLFSVGGGFVGAGLLGQYYANTSLSGTPAFTRTDVRIDADWDGASPAGSTSPGFADFPGTNWSAKWTGSIIPAYSQAYTFTTISDDGIRVIVNGQTVINDWTAHAAATDNGTINLVAGKTYSIEVDYYQEGGSSEAHLLWSSASTPKEVIESATPLGINGGTAADYDNSLMFADVVKMSRGWTAVSSPWGANIATDSSGWPTTDAALPLFDAPGREGTYALTFNGSATLSTNGTYAGVTIFNQQYNAATNTTTATITLSTEGVAGAGQSALALIFTNTQRTATSATNTGVTNVTLMRPTTDGDSASLPAGTLFTPEYETLLSNFTTIRFMDYLNTNVSTIQTWADRTLPGQITQNQPNGGSLEYAVELANETGKDLYINVPFYADDDYVTKLAELIKYGSDGVNPYTSVQANPLYPPLNSGLKVYIEYSNENWNLFSTQTDAAAIAAANAGSPINYDGLYPSNDSAGWTIAQRYVAERTVEISNDFRAVYGDSEMPGTSADPTVRPLLEWQYGGNWGQIGLDFINNYYDNADGLNHVADPHAVNYFLWGGGGAWYSNTNNDGAATIDAIYASGLDGPASVLSDVQLAAQFGLKDVGYEGGFKVGGDTSTTMQIAANVDPRAEALTLATVDEFFAAGGDLPIVYSASGAAQYTYSVEANGLGATDIFRQNTPKMQAYEQVEQSLPPVVTNGYALPTTVTQPLVINEGDIFSQPNDSAVATYLLNASSAGTYTVTIQGTADSSATKEHLLLDGTNLGSVAIPLWSSGVGNSSVVTFTVEAAGVYGLAVYDDGPTRINYTGNLTISLVAPTGAPITSTTGTPVLSSEPVNVAVGGTASASSQNNPVEGAAEAFDGTSSTKWLSFTPTAWLQYQFANGAQQTVDEYSITSANDDYGRDPASWQVLGSNDGIHWNLLDTQTNQTFAGRETTNTYTLSSAATYNYFHLSVTGNTGGSYLQLSEWGLFNNPFAVAATPSTLTLLTGGTATASSQNNPVEGAAQAFDNNSSTKWLAFSNTASLSYQTAQSNIVTQYSITSANDVPARDPVSWRVIGSNDGIHWTVLDIQNNQTFSTRFQTNTYTMNNTTAYTYYALKITANAGDVYTQLADWSLYTNTPAVPAVQAPSPITGGTASASSENDPNEGSAQAFDNDSTTKWLAFASTAWLQYAAPIGQVYAVTQYSITSANDDYGRDPQDWQLLASNDGVNWTVLDTQTAQTFSGRETTNTYTLANTQAYTYYRLNITANDGGADTQLADLNLFGSVLDTGSAMEMVSVSTSPA
jgi:hypothetical protein